MYIIYFVVLTMILCRTLPKWVMSHRFDNNSSPYRQNGRYFTDDIFRCIFEIENVCIFIKISLKFVLKGLIDKKTALV